MPSSRPYPIPYSVVVLILSRTRQEAVACAKHYGLPRVRWEFLRDRNYLIGHDRATTIWRTGTWQWRHGLGEIMATIRKRGCPVVDKPLPGALSLVDADANTEQR